MQRFPSILTSLMRYVVKSQQMSQCQHWLHWFKRWHKTFEKKEILSFSVFGKLWVNKSSLTLESKLADKMGSVQLNPSLWKLWFPKSIYEKIFFKHMLSKKIWVMNISASLFKVAPQCLLKKKIASIRATITFVPVNLKGSFWGNLKFLLYLN